MYLSTAAALCCSTPGNLRVAEDAANRLRALLENPPAERGRNQHVGHEPRAFRSTYTGDIIKPSQRILRVEVCVDLDRLDDESYRERLIEDGRRVAWDFLWNEVDR